jgi:tRNA pseudouridine38-40 synthase
MNRAASLLCGKHDFSSYMASGSKVESTVRDMKYASVCRDGDVVKITLAADGFLYNMVRIIVGTLLEVSEGKISVQRLSQAIEEGKRELAGRTAPAEGLYLNRVFLDANAKTEEARSDES